MKLRSLTLTLAGLALAAVSSAQFADQTLAVIAVGDGTTTLSNAGVPTQLQNFLKDGTAGAATVNLGIFNSGSSTSEGVLLKDGSTGGNLYAIGYTAGGAAVSGTTGAANPRVISSFNPATGAVSTITLAANDFSGNSPRSAVLQNGTIYAGGAGTEGGVLTGAYSGGPSLDLTRVGVSSNARVAQFLGGTLYYSGASTAGGAVIGINVVNPDGTNTAVANLGTGASPYDFFFSNPDTLYIADDRPATSGGGLYTATRVNGVFGTPSRILATSVRQLAFDGTTIFATTTETSNNSILSISLDGTSSSVLASAGTNRAFRGIEVVPEPATMAAMALGLGAMAARRRRKSA